MTALLITGCGALLGLDEFTDSPAAGAGGTGGADAAPCERGDTRPCYEGASETEGVGLCAAGEQTCGADGSWGACEEQVLPGEEDCNERGDEDCDGVGCSDVVWARMSSAGPDRYATSVAVSPRGDRIALAGIYRGEINFGPNATTILPEHSRGGAFLAIFDGEGNHLRSLGLPLGGDGFAVVTLDAESNVLFATKYTGTVNLGGGDLPASGTSDMLVVKLDADGGHVWSKQFGGPEGQISPVDMAVSPDGDAVMTGIFSGAVTFGDRALETAETSDTDSFLLRLSGEDGGHVYSVQIGDSEGYPPGAQYGKGVGVDGMGRAVVAGTFVTSVDFGSGHTRDSASMGASGWVAQYAPKGTLLWNTIFDHGDGSNVEISGVGVDPAGNAGIVGLFSGKVRFQGTSNSVEVTRETTGADDDDLFVVRLSATGTHSWSKQLGDATKQNWAVPIHGAALDSEGDLVFAGSFLGKVDFGGGELTANDSDWFVAKFDASGNHRWSHRYGSGAAGQAATSAAIVPETREIVVAGTSDGALDLIDPPLMMDNFSVVMARMSP
ncbi:hypothetical protein WME75_03455 [Sorangium sp. So ce1014]|uniref:hypothetical protein n=1 Tax=Sorangium sp. So ce1014 TaxID=3133326 RepID=UPI003F638FBE